MMMETRDPPRATRRETEGSSPIRPLRIRNLDLRLLLILDALLVEGSVTHAARRLGMSQPAVSAALARLRHILKDDLFTREPGGMRPTPRALELAIPISQALRQLEAAVQPAEFVPAESTRSFRIAIANHSEVVLLPELIERLRRDAPLVQIHALPKPNREVPRMLDSNIIDFAIGAIGEMPSRFRRATLYHDEFVCVGRHDHPLLKSSTITLEDFVSVPHLLVTSTGESRTLLDQVLAKRHVERDIQYTVKHFLAALPILKRTDAVAGWFRRSFDAVLGATVTDLVIRPLPLEPMSVDIVWHPELTAHPAY
jgi:DNA-binding transcriptional LysR family regulator